MGDAISSESYTPRQRTTYRRRLEDELERFDRHLQGAEFVDHGTIGLELELNLVDDTMLPLSLIHISEPTRRTERSRMPSSA